MRFKCDGTRAETGFRLSTKRTSPFKSAGASVQSTTSSQGVRISGSNAEYTMFRGTVKSTGYPLHSSVSASLPLPYFTVCHHISMGLYSISGIYNGTAAIGWSTMAEITCIKLNCLLEISFSPNVGLSVSWRTESTHWTATGSEVLILQFLMNKGTQISNWVPTNKLHDETDSRIPLRRQGSATIKLSQCL